MKLMYAARSVKGMRESNQDNFLAGGRYRLPETPDLAVDGALQQDASFFAVCDGMGGEEQGDVASCMAVRLLCGVPEQTLCSQWEQELQRVNAAIGAHAARAHIRMGTTFAGVLVQEKSIRAVNVGDSRIYRIRAGGLTRMSVDHTEFQAMVDAGVLQPEEGAGALGRNCLTQYLGVPQDDVALSPHVTMAKPQAGDRYLICSDGLHGSVAESELPALASARDLPQACEDLVQAAVRAGSADNITVVLIELAAEETAPAPERPAAAAAAPDGPGPGGSRKNGVLAAVLVLLALLGIRQAARVLRDWGKNNGGVFR